MPKKYQFKANLGGLGIAAVYGFSYTALKSLTLPGGSYGTCRA